MEVSTDGFGEFLEELLVDLVAVERRGIVVGVVVVRV